MKIQASWNHAVTLKPNAAGWRLYDLHHTRYGIAPPKHGETLRIQLWEAAQIFGGSLSIGTAMPFADSFFEIEIADPKGENP